ncbi:MAG TPA: hypothetical protein V6D29_13455, partial [Leptolyngbyaceae cyanobacterium]
ISIGKIIVLKILQYAMEHPLQVAGLALGIGATYAIGVAVHSLCALAPAVTHWPFIGGMLAKLASAVAGLFKAVFMPAMVAAPLVGVIAGELFDQKYPQISDSLQKVAKDFFELFSGIINSIQDELDFNEANQAFS